MAMCTVWQRGAVPKTPRDSILAAIVEAKKKIYRHYDRMRGRPENSEVSFRSVGRVHGIGVAIDALCRALFVTKDELSDIHQPLGLCQKLR